MTSTSETGHAKNVANFNNLILFVTGYGESYNPTNNSITLMALQTIETNANNAIDAVNATLSAYNNAIAAREAAFKPLSKLVTRVMNFLKASGVSEQVYDSVRTVARKIQGVRASPKTTAQTGNGESARDDQTKQISSSQMSYDNRLENFDKFIQLLNGITEYNPNEEELKITGLTAFCEDLRAKNNATTTAEVPLSNARISRNEVLYAQNNGLYDIAITVKNYVKAVFGASSPQYKQISKLRFVRHH